ncbi:hypothetical protein [Bradyrhizobium sp.]|uniref:hypothetical protein n=1 Tax=Bradyrhizobium sp. TaxID=376 RepID=UPI003C3885F2
MAVKHQYEVKQLRAAYQEAWKTTLDFLKWCGEQETTPRETTVEEIQEAIGASRREMADLVSGIIEVKIGTRIIGRHGSKTRLRWLFTLRSIEKVARGETEILVETGSDTPFASDHLREYSYPLREDEEQVLFKLPRDLTQREADRLALYIRSLPKD